MIIIVILVLIIVLVFDLIIVPHILIAVLGAFGLHVTYWIALGIVFLLNLYFAKSKSSNKKD
jgi:hypothetical protein